MRTANKISRLMKRILLSALGGVFAGLASLVFLLSLDFVTRYRIDHPQIIWALPVAGLLIGLLYHHLGQDAAGGNNLILDEIHDPKRVLPIYMAPYILVATVLTHLFGGSAGREGTAVQMGASLADQLGRIFSINADERKILLMAGAGAGFGAAIGAPWAGAIFGMEVVFIGRIRFTAVFECVIASFAGYETAVILGAPHSVYPRVMIPSPSWPMIGYVLMAGILFGLAARAFIWSTHLWEKFSARRMPYAPLRPLLGGALVVLLFSLEGSFRYTGLGISYIQEALGMSVSFKEPLLKSFFTSLTVGSGFKGGEFIPLVYIGTTLGSALSGLFSLPPGLLAALGFAAVFGGAANTPLACTVMAMEIFGMDIALYAFVACFMSYSFSGYKGIYKTQRVHRPKWPGRWFRKDGP